MLPAGPRGGQEQKIQGDRHCFQQEKLGAAAAPAGEGSGWGGSRTPSPSGSGKAGMELLTQGTGAAARVILTQKTPFPPALGLQRWLEPPAPAPARCQRGFTRLRSVPVVSDQRLHRGDISPGLIAPESFIERFGSYLSSPGTAAALTASRQRRQRRQQPPQHRPPGLSHAGSGAPLPLPAARSPSTQRVPSSSSAAAAALGAAPRARRFLFCWVPDGWLFPGRAEREGWLHASLLPKAKEKTTKISPFPAGTLAGRWPNPAPAAPHAPALVRSTR